MVIQKGKKYKGKINGAVIQIQNILTDSFSHTMIEYTDKENNKFCTNLETFGRCSLEDITED